MTTDLMPYPIKDTYTQIAFCNRRIYLIHDSYLKSGKVVPSRHGLSDIFWVDRETTVVTRVVVNLTTTNCHDVLKLGGDIVTDHDMRMELINSHNKCLLTRLTTAGDLRYLYKRLNPTGPFFDPVEMYKRGDTLTNFYLPRKKEAPKIFSVTWIDGLFYVLRRKAQQTYVLFDIVNMQAVESSGDGIIYFHR